MLWIKNDSNDNAFLFFGKNKASLDKREQDKLLYHKNVEKLEKILTDIGETRQKCQAVVPALKNDCPKENEELSLDKRKQEKLLFQKNVEKWEQTARVINETRKLFEQSKQKETLQSPLQLACNRLGLL